MKERSPFRITLPWMFALTAAAAFGAAGIGLNILAGYVACVVAFGLLAGTYAYAELNKGYEESVAWIGISSIVVSIVYFFSFDVFRFVGAPQSFFLSLLGGFIVGALFSLIPIFLLLCWELRLP